MFKIFQFIGKFLKIFFFGIVPFILLAGGSKGDVDRFKVESGTYSFSFNGELSFRLEGVATFENRIEVDKFGDTINKLLLRFTSIDDLEMQKLEFIIASNTKKHHGVSVGVHKIKNLDCLFNSFNGVYGFADLGSVSELPFFIKSGDINITESYSNHVDGKLQVQLENANGESLNVKGPFIADIKV
jgi:hypothetical protein